MQDDNTSVNALNDAPVEEVVTESSPAEAVQSEPQITSEQRENELPEYAKERLGIQKKRFEKQIAQMQRQIDVLSQVAPRQYDQQPQMQIEPGSVQEQVIKTLATLAQQKKQEDENTRLHQIQEDIRNEAVKYDDFDDVVYDPETPFTVPIAHATLELPNTADVQYHLAKNRKELVDLAKLHPIDMRKRLIKLSVDLMNKKPSVQVPKAPRPMENLKANPLTKSTSGITAQSSVSEIRRMLKNRK